MTNKEIFELLKGSRKLKLAPETVRMCKIRPVAQRGEMHSFAKLTNSQVAEIRHLSIWREEPRIHKAFVITSDKTFEVKVMEDGRRMYRRRPTALAREYGVTYQTIYLITKGFSRKCQ